MVPSGADDSVARVREVFDAFSGEWERLRKDAARQPTSAACSSALASDRSRPSAAALSEPGAAW
jgi:hypothetical protein